MTMSLLAGSQPQARAQSSARWEVKRESITWRDVAPGRVLVEFLVENAGELPTPPTLATLSAAPFGAFVAWTPLKTLPVPPLAPGGSVLLSAEVARRKAKPLGKPERIRPRRLLTALGMNDDRRVQVPPTRRDRAETMPSPALGLGLAQMIVNLLGLRQDADQPTLPVDLFELIGRGTPHYAGNLNVFVGRQNVERHLAQALRIYPGRTNLAMFMVGMGRDAYRFSLHGYERGWDAAIFDLTSFENLALGIRNGCPVVPQKWVEMPTPGVMSLALVPPADCGPAHVEVHVEQRSSGQEAVVEFSLDPAAAGPGCYVVS